jgi:transglutaminase-like putative cysteine protease
MSRAGAGAVVPVERFFELSLVGLLASGLLAVTSSGYLDAPALGWVAAGLLLRTLRVSLLPRLRCSGRWLAALAAAGVVFFPLDYALLSRAWLPASLHLAFFWAGLGVAAARPGRNQAGLAVLALAALLAASLVSTNLYFFAALAAFLLFGVAAFASAEVCRSARKSRQVVAVGVRGLDWRLAVLSGFLALGILVLTGGMFFVLPRTAQVAFRRLAPERFRVPGFSHELALGQISRLRRAEALVMRVRFYGRGPAAGLKWRGDALAQFDGRRWFNPPGAGQALPASEGLVRLAENRQLWRPGRRITYEVRLGAIASDTLFLAGIPEFVHLRGPTVIRTSGDGYRLASGTSEGLRYGVYSFMEPGQGPELGPAAAEPAPARSYLSLPRLDPRIAALARQITAGQDSGEGRARALEEYLRRHHGYTVRPVSDRAAEPLADFLLRRRQGHCEYFASAMAVLLRLVGVPARVVTGFQSGVFNPVSGWQVIRASDAHSWVEAWMGGRGWVTFDPTPPLPAPVAPALWMRLGWYVDAAETFWDEWVLRYDLDRQLVLASKMESSGRDLSTQWRDRVHARAAELKDSLVAWGRRYGLVVLAAAALAGAAYAGAPRIRAHSRARRRLRQAERGAAQPSDATLLYTRLLSLLARRGYEKPAWLTPAEFARRLPASPTGRLVEDFTRAYNELRFGGRRAAALRMAALLEEIRRAARQSAAA